MADIATVVRVQSLAELAAKEEGYFELPGEGIPGYVIKRVIPRGLCNHRMNIVSVIPGSGKHGHAHPEGVTVFVFLEGEGEYLLDDITATPCEARRYCCIASRTDSRDEEYGYRPPAVSVYRGANSRPRLRASRHRGRGWPFRWPSSFSWESARSPISPLTTRSSRQSFLITLEAGSQVCRC